MNSELINEVYLNLKSENSLDTKIKSEKIKKLKLGLTLENFKLNEKINNLNPGNYSILNFKNLFNSNENKKYFIEILSNELKKYISNKNMNNILIVGLGNRHINADSLGSKVLKNLIITGHIDNLKSLKKVSAICPSVLGLTGIESFNIVSSIIKDLKPSLVITIDSLCANNPNRLGISFQINNAGIIPGAGINNSRKEFNKKTLNANIISIGVPLLIYASTFNDNDKSFDNLIVTMKDIEEISLIDAEVISYALNMSIHNLTFDECKDYLNKL